VTWVRLDDGAPLHPKLLAVGPEAAWLWVASAGRTTAEGSGVDLPCTGLGGTAPEAIAALCEVIAAPAIDPAEEALA